MAYTHPSRIDVIHRTCNRGVNDSHTTAGSTCYYSLASTAWSQEDDLGEIIVHTPQLLSTVRSASSAQEGLIPGLGQRIRRMHLKDPVDVPWPRGLKCGWGRVKIKGESRRCPIPVGSTLSTYSFLLLTQLILSNV